MPSSCDAGCAAVFLPFWTNCRYALGSSGDSYRGVVNLCEASVDMTSYRCECTGGWSGQECDYNAPPPPAPKDCDDFSNPAGDNVTMTCPKYTGPDGQEVDCTLCNPNKHSDKPCPSGCNCLAYCNPDKGVVARPASAAPLTSVM